MRYRSIAALAASALLGTLAGCKDAGMPLEPAPPTLAPTLPPPHVPADSAGYPLLSRPGVIYNRMTPSFVPGTSRYVLYDDSSFSVQYVHPQWGFFEYPGTYAGANSGMRFTFDGWNTAGPWLADGIIEGDSLTVTYNLVMSMADFEDGVYVRVR